MSDGPRKMFPWWGYLELYLFGVFGTFVALAMGVNALDLSMELFVGSLFVLGPLTFLAPAVGIYGIERARRALASEFIGERELPTWDPDADAVARAQITNKRSMLTYALGRTQDIPFEEALGAFMPIRILIALFMMLATLVLYVIVMMESQGVELFGASLFLLFIFGIGAVLTFLANLALAYVWRGSVRATTHLVEGRRALVARREAIEASQLGGALSMGVASDGGGELSMSHAGELTEAAYASSRDEDVMLDLDAEEEQDVVEMEQVQGG